MHVMRLLHVMWFNAMWLMHVLWLLPQVKPWAINVTLHFINVTLLLPQVKPWAINATLHFVNVTLLLPQVKPWAINATLHFVNVTLLLPQVKPWAINVTLDFVGVTLLLPQVKTWAINVTLHLVNVTLLLPQVKPWAINVTLHFVKSKASIFVTTVETEVRAERCMARPCQLAAFNNRRSANCTNCRRSSHRHAAMPSSILLVHILSNVVHLNEPLPEVSVVEHSASSHHRLTESHKQIAFLPQRQVPDGDSCAAIHTRPAVD